MPTTTTALWVPMDVQPEQKADGLHFPWATFFNNGHVHTWDREGIGGQNWNVNDYPDEDKYAAAIKRTPYENPCPYKPGDVVEIDGATWKVSSAVPELLNGLWGWKCICEECVNENGI